MFDGKAAILPHVLEQEEGDPAGVLLSEQGKEALVQNGTMGRVVSLVSPLRVLHHQFELLQDDDVVFEVPHGGDGKAALDLAEMGAGVQFDKLVHLLLSTRSRLMWHGDQTPGGSSVVGGSSVGNDSRIVVRSLVIAHSSGVERWRGSGGGGAGGISLSRLSDPIIPEISKRRRINPVTAASPNISG